MKQLLALVVLCATQVCAGETPPQPLTPQDGFISIESEAARPDSDYLRASAIRKKWAEDAKAAYDKANPKTDYTSYLIGGGAVILFTVGLFIGRYSKSK